jgi:hypothetical protein
MEPTSFGMALRWETPRFTIPEPANGAIDLQAEFPAAINCLRGKFRSTLRQIAAILDELDEAQIYEETSALQASLRG